MSYGYVGGDTFFDDAGVNVLEDLPRSWGGGKWSNLSTDDLIKMANEADEPWNRPIEELCPSDEEIVFETRNKLGRKFEVADLTHTGAAGTELYEIAARWLPTQTEAQFDWLRDTARKFSRGGQLTDGTAKGVLNCYYNEIKRSREGSVREVMARHNGSVDDKMLDAEIAQAEEYEAFVKCGGADFDPAAVSHGYYTVIIGKERRTIKIGKWTADKFREGRKIRWISFLSGPSNTSDYTMFARQHDTGEWVIMPKFRNGYGILNSALMILFGRDGEGRDAARKEYAMESGNCFRCNRLLTDPESIEFGIGPECRGKIGF